MKCIDFQDLLNSYVGDELEERLRIEVESHLLDCADCSREAADWQTCLNSLRVTFPEQAPPLELWEKIQAKT